MDKIGVRIMDRAILNINNQRNRHQLRRLHDLRRNSKIREIVNYGSYVSRKLIIKHVLRLVKNHRYRDLSDIQKQLDFISLWETIIYLTYVMIIFVMVDTYFYDFKSVGGSNDINLFEFYYCLFIIFMQAFIIFCGLCGVARVEGTFNPWVMRLFSLFSDTT